MDKIRQKMLDQKKKAMIKALKDKQAGKPISSENGSKNFHTSGETVTFNAKVNDLIKTVKNDVSEIYKTFNFDTEKLISYIEENGTKVYRVNNATSLLEKINEHTGFITPLEGTKAIYVNTITSQGTSMKSEAMFIISADKKTDFYMLLREFYLWYSYKKNLSGFDYKTQEIFKKYLNEKRNNDLNKLDLNGMQTLKEALARDSEANEFVMEIVRQKEGGTNVMKKIQQGGAEI